MVCAPTGPLHLASLPHGRALQGDVGRYVTLGRIATGGMASIVLACPAAEPDTRVVIKRIQDRYGDNPELIGFFAQERRLMGLCDHPNIARRIDAGWHEGAPFLVLEHIEGADLVQIVRLNDLLDRKPSCEVSVKITCDLLDALDHVHTRRNGLDEPLGIVHRDVSPMNVLVSTDGEVKLIDFGIATAADGLHDRTRKTLRGRLPYIAPEQFRGQPFDCRADLWSVGVLLWESLVGRVLFHDATRSGLLRQILREPLRSIRSKRSDVPDDLIAVVEALLQRDPNARVASAAQARSMLLAVAEGHGWDLSNRHLARKIRRLRSDAGYSTKGSLAPLSLVPDIGTPEVKYEPRVLARKRPPTSRPFRRLVAVAVAGLAVGAAVAAMNPPESPIGAAAGIHSHR